MRHNSSTVVGTTLVADAQFLLYISGLPFSSGSCYNTRLGPTNQSALGCVNFTAAQFAGTTNSILSGLVSFDKPLQDVIHITIELKNSSSSATSIKDNYSEKTTTPLGHWSVVCDI